ncbi:MAG: RluA family pseudouridine synthase [Lachnospiraceae bacterium]|nr:RluA family pseudouridine synthase [Lachnospiraceae bacterium]
MAENKDLSFTVPEELAGFRLDKGISEYYEEISRSRISKVIKDGGVSVNGRAMKASSILEASDKVSFTLPDSAIPDIEPEDIPLDILYEDDAVIIVNKPKGMVVHPAAGHYSGTLVNALMYHCKDLSGINGVLRPGIVHRIDKDTTGSLIVCKNDRAHRDIAGQLAIHSIDRRYRAVVHGRFAKDMGTVDLPIGRDRRDRKKMAVDPAGKRAVTHYRVLESFKEYSYIECRLETGRTHQIRVHMAHTGHPVLGDEVYGFRKTGIKTCGQTLHAFFLGFKSPATGEYTEVTAPIPEYFNEILEKLRS